MYMSIERAPKGPLLKFRTNLLDAQTVHFGLL